MQPKSFATLVPINFHWFQLYLSPSTFVKSFIYNQIIFYGLKLVLENQLLEGLKKDNTSQPFNPLTKNVRWAEKSLDTGSFWLLWDYYKKNSQVFIIQAILIKFPDPKKPYHNHFSAVKLNIKLHISYIILELFFPHLKWFSPFLLIILPHPQLNQMIRCNYIIIEAIMVEDLFCFPFLDCHNLELPSSKLAWIWLKSKPFGKMFIGIHSVYILDKV